MPTSVQQTSNDLLRSVRDGTYPDSEDVVTSDLSGEAIKGLLEGVEQEKKSLEEEISALSRKAAPNVDSWIAQAEQLQQDIAKSRAIARQILEEHERGKRHLSEGYEARAKVELLNEEIEYNASVASKLVQMKRLIRELDEIEELATNRANMDLPEKLVTLHGEIDKTSDNNSRRLLLERHDQLIQVIQNQYLREFESLLTVTPSANGCPTITVHGTPQNHDALLLALKQLGSDEVALTSTARRIIRLVAKPIVNTKQHFSNELRVNAGTLTLRSTKSSKTVDTVLTGLCATLDFLGSHLPSGSRKYIISAIMADISSAVVDDWLVSALPLEVFETDRILFIQGEVKRLIKVEERYTGSSSLELTEWVNNIPQNWLICRQAASLEHVRKIFTLPRGPTRQVERVERQMVSRNDETFAQKAVDNDWDAAWGEEPSDSAQVKTDEDDEWGFNEDGEEKTNDSVKDNKEAEEGDAWGWKDSRPNSPTPEKRPSATNGIHRVTDRDEREITLMETYTITDVPDCVLEVIGRDLMDAAELKRISSGPLSRPLVVEGLQSIPHLTLSLFRAISPTYYNSNLPSGNIHLYNDALYIADKLSSFATSIPAMQSAIDTLTKFEKSSYSREIEQERGVLIGYLNGADGFSNCTHESVAQSCMDAISNSIDRVRQKHLEWSTILSRSALLSSIGTLIKSIIEQFIRDVKELGDISEPQSQRLSSFCEQIIRLEDLFMPDAEEAGAEAMPLTAVYVPKWLRLQYLSQILESNLKEIEYLWTESELSLEFSADEVIDLVKALFDESRSRHNLIRVIRGNAGLR